MQYNLSETKSNREKEKKNSLLAEQISVLIAYQDLTLKHLSAV